ALRGEVPVGAVVVGPEGQIVARAGNRTLELRDPTAHAEMLAIREACRVLDSERLVGCDLYVTLEPCPMCAGAISFARLRRLY
ncbi:nucleoside deaminase, partial [Escherichia coli]|uniref:nucleoside deaminase n=1 Tax=Escherichia coli TaxID=562 RepID=UPI001BB1A2EC